MSSRATSKFNEAKELLQLSTKRLSQNLNIVKCFAMISTITRDYLWISDSFILTVYQIIALILVVLNIRCHRGADFWHFVKLMFTFVTKFRRENVYRSLELRGAEMGKNYFFLLFYFPVILEGVIFVCRYYRWSDSVAGILTTLERKYVFIRWHM